MLSRIDWLSNFVAILKTQYFLTIYWPIFTVPVLPLAVPSVTSRPNDTLINLSPRKVLTVVLCIIVDLELYYCNKLVPYARRSTYSILKTVALALQKVWIEINTKLAMNL
mmetsp:Transcript_6112/g.10850  ORF Transcript_6112/g.10850 Transcript_6112/m.10850 type:complete len:110 (-) Transcript_6112:2408-2737(-)